MEKVLNRINIRHFLVSNLDRYIQESIYYRNFSFEINNDNKTIIYNFLDDYGKGEIE